MRALVTRAVPYVRKRANVQSPTLIINRWSGDGKAERYGLAAADAGIRTVMLERGDDLTQLAHDAIDAGADAIGMAVGDGSLGLVAAVAIERNVPFFGGRRGRLARRRRDRQRCCDHGDPSHLGRAVDPAAGAGAQLRPAGEITDPSHATCAWPGATDGRPPDPGQDDPVSMIRVAGVSVLS